MVGDISEQSRMALARMNGAQLHRGPDDEGYWASHLDGSGAQFMFRRLAIIDLSPGGHQPMKDGATGNVIVFNGEIYNYRELKRELSAAGVAFETHSDTEVLLKAYGHWGHESFGRLRGMFAFAIWDAGKRCVVAARDRLGIKPLYFAKTTNSSGDKVVAFASELRALLASEWIPKRLNSTAVATYVANGFVAGDDSIVENVSQLMPGMSAVFGLDGTVNLSRYWQYPQAGSIEQDVDHLEAELRTAIRQHLVSDVPLGIFLSGGIDSSAIAALAVEEAGPDGVCTYNLGFEEARFDQAESAEAVARELGTKHHTINLTEEKFKAQLSDALSCIDQPTFDALNSYFVSRAVREAGITVALAGTGGDELFGGYRSFSEVPLARAVSAATGFLPDGMLRMIGNAIATVATSRGSLVKSQSRWGKSEDVLCARGSVVDLYQVSYSLFTERFRKQLLDRDCPRIRCGVSTEMHAFLESLVDEKNLLHSISLLELVNFIGERLLRDTDCAGMAVSLEVRVPLLDHVVVEACANVETSRRFKPLGRKQLLRDLALGKMDRSLFERPKQGFVLPLEEWSRQSLQGDIDAVFGDEDLCASVGLNAEAVSRLWESFKAKSPGVYWSRVWALFVLLWWCRKYGLAQ